MRTSAWPRSSWIVRSGVPRIASHEAKGVPDGVGRELLPKARHPPRDGKRPLKLTDGEGQAHRIG
jgi:hypothetical protein